MRRVFLCRLRCAIRLVIIALGLAVISRAAQAGFVDFEGFADNFTITNEVPGLSFSGATVLTAGLSLNEIDFPPTSGENVVAGLSGGLSIDFAPPVSMMSAFFTFGDSLRFSGFDSGGGLLFDFISPLAPNLGTSNLIEISSFGLFAVQIGTQDGSAFTMDDLSYLSANSVPEPSTLSLLALVGLGAVSIRRRVAAY